MNKGPFSGIKKAVNSKTVGICFDGDIWRDIVLNLTKEHAISEYNLNRIIVFSFPLWGKRCPLSLAPRDSIQKKLSLEAGDKRWTYTVSSADILNSLMGWKKFKALMDRAIRTLKPSLSRLDELFVSRKKCLGTLAHERLYEARPLAKEIAFGKETEPLAVSLEENDCKLEELNNLLYGEYEDEDEQKYS